MKKFFLHLTVSFIFILFNLLLFQPHPVQATELVKGPIFKTGESIHFTDTVDGDVFLFGSDVTVNATISGDLIIAAGQADVNGTIDGDLRIAAGQIDINAQINDDVTIAGGQVKLDSNTQIKNTLTAAAGTVALNGQVQAKTWLNGGQINILSQARLLDDLKIFHQSEPYIHPQSRISGDLITQQFESDNNYSSDRYFPNQPKILKKLTLFVVVQKIVALAIEILLGSLLIVLMPKLIKSITKLSQTEPGKNIGWGFLTVIIVPIASVLLFISLIGIPVAVVVLMLYAFSFYLARVIADISLGNSLLKDKPFKKPFHSLALGLLLLGLLKLIPVLGWLTYFIFILNGLGTLYLFFKTYLKVKK